MRRFLVPRESIRNANVVEPEHDPLLDAANNKEFDPAKILCDPALRKQVAEYAPEVQDQVRRTYILKGPTQPILKFLVRVQEHVLNHGT
jgi:hypothetical protein